MPLSLDDLLAGLERSREHFYKHLEGLRDDQWDFKPFPECKSIRETMQHLVVDDRAALNSLKSGEEPDYETGACDETNLERLKAILKETHKALLDEIRARYSKSPIDADICVWGSHGKLGAALP